MHIISLYFNPAMPTQFVGKEKKSQGSKKQNIYNNILVMITCENVVNIVQNSWRMKWKSADREKQQGKTMQQQRKPSAHKSMQQ